MSVYVSCTKMAETQMIFLKVLLHGGLLSGPIVVVHCIQYRFKVCTCCSIFYVRDQR